MNKIDLTSAFLVFVLSAGLISCSKEQKTRDSYRAPSPVISDSKGAQDLQVWDRRSNKSLDLQDSVDVSAGRPSKVEVIARCRRDQQSYLQTFSPSPREPVKIFQVLPEELLTYDLGKEKIDCAFELILFNDVGSRHIFQITTSPITEQRPSAVEMESPPQPGRLLANKLEGVRARYRHLLKAAAQVICRDLQTADLPFDQVIELSNFDFSKPLLREGRSSETLTENVIQTCRIKITESGQTRQVGPRFSLQLPRAPMTLQLEPAANSVTERQAFSRGQPLTVTTATLANPAAGTRYLRVMKTAGKSLVETYRPQKGSFKEGRIPTTQVKAVYSRNWLFLRPLAANGVQVSEFADHFVVSVREGGQIRFSLVLDPQVPMHCHGGVDIFGAEHMMASGELRIHEISPQGEEVHPVLLQFSNLVFSDSGVSAAQIAAAPAANTPCGW